jgi:predicted ATPase
MASPPAPDRDATPWRLRLLGAIEARWGAVTVTRWPSRAAILLLARLALPPQQAHAREVLAEWLWPGTDHAVARNRLRQVLSTLRSQLEGPGGGPVLQADRLSIRLLPGRVRCDAQDFEQALQRGDRAAARAAYGGELLPGFYDDWVIETRRYLAERFERLQDDPVPPLPADTLPAHWTRAFGLAPQVAALQARLRDSRLLSILGAGGSGKTRLAVELARTLRGRGTAAPDGWARITFVPLADCRDGADVVQALAVALQLGGSDPLAQLGPRLAVGRVLLVLDNAEQVVQPLRAIASRMLQAAPQLHLLVTSRRRLHLAGEQGFELEGLPLPAPDADARTLRDNPAVALLIDRAQAQCPGLAVDDATLPAVAALARLLDGLPLALELAASRMGSLSAATLLAWLGDADAAHAGRSRLELLSRDGAAEPRHASMAAVIGWSWQLLDADEQRLLAAIAVTAGSVDLPLLAQVLHEPLPQVARRADALVGHSLLRAAAGHEAPRLDMAEALREFIRQRWPADAQNGLRAAWLSTLAHWARARGRCPDAAALAHELPTVRVLLGTDAALDAAPADALALLLALRPHWESVGMPLPLQQRLEGLLARLPATALPAAASAAHELLAYLRFEAGCVPEAARHAERALQLAGDDPGLRARALVRRCWVTLAQHRAEDRVRLDAERSELQQALDLARLAGDAEAEARALHQWSVLLGQLGEDWAGAEAALARAQALWQGLGDTRKAMARLRNRGQCWLWLGRADEARQAFEQSLQAARADGDVVGCIDSLLSLSTLHAHQRRWAQALAADRECVALCWRHWHRHGLAYALWNPARALAHLRQPEAALRLMAFAARFWQTGFGPLTRADRRTVRTVQALVRRQIGAARAAQCWAEGEAMAVDRAVALLSATATTDA